MDGELVTKIGLFGVAIGLLVFALMLFARMTKQVKLMSFLGGSFVVIGMVLVIIGVNQEKNNVSTNSNS